MLCGGGTTPEMSSNTNDPGNERIRNRQKTSEFFSTQLFQTKKLEHGNHRQKMMKM